jgi:hypothetical protein
MFSTTPYHHSSSLRHNESIRKTPCKRLFQESTEDTDPNPLPSSSTNEKNNSLSPPYDYRSSSGKRPRTSMSPLFVDRDLDEDTKKLSIDENTDCVTNLLSLDDFVVPDQPPTRPQFGHRTQSCVTVRRGNCPETIPHNVIGVPRISLTQPRPTAQHVRPVAAGCKTPLRPSVKPSSPGRLQIPFNVNPWSPRPPERAPLVPQRHQERSIDLFEYLFSLRGTLGQGSFGTVYRCLHLVDGCEYAIKVISLKGNKDLRRKLKEVYALSAIPGHPNLVRYFTSWVSEDNHLYIQLEYCDGGNLQEITQPLNEEELRELIFQLSSGLACLHSFNMVHEDIKPENIYIKTFQTSEADGVKVFIIILFLFLF